MTQTMTGRRPQVFAAPPQYIPGEPHYRMTLSMARWEFERGYATIKGYLYHLIKSSRKDGHKFRIPNVKAFCEEHSISMSAYYKAIVDLKADGVLDSSPLGGADVWVPQNIICVEDSEKIPGVPESLIVLDADPKPPVPAPPTIEQEKVPNSRKQSKIVESDSTILEKNGSKMMDSDSKIMESASKRIEQASKISEKKEPEAIDDKAFSVFSDLIQLSFNFFIEEREREKNFDDLQRNEVNNSQQIELNQGASQEATDIPKDQKNNYPKISRMESKNVGKDKFSAPGSEPEFLKRDPKWATPSGSPNPRAEHQTPPAPRPKKSAKKSEWETFVAPGPEPEFFDFVVRLTDKFKIPPAEPMCAAESWIRKQGNILYAQYLKWQEGQKQAAARSQLPLVEVAPPPKPEPTEMTPQMWLERYQQMWQAGPQMQKHICSAITQHPDRGLQIGENGPELASGGIP